MKTFKPSNSIQINRLLLVITGLMLILSLQSNAQTQSKIRLSQMIDEDRTTIDAIAISDKKIRPDILLVSETPELLAKIEELQKRSQDQFKTIIERYDRDAQSAFYEIARYPGLITDLVTQGRPSESEVDRIVSRYPQDIHEIAKNNAIKYFDVLVQIERLNTEIDRAFQYALEPYPVQIRESVNVLLGNPEVVSALVNDKEFTALLGEVYREDPDWVMNRINQASQEVSARNHEDLEAYKNQIQKDPQAYNEMLDASEKFAQERNEVRYLDNYSEPVVETRMINSYPYWFGYPYWYSDPYWRPLPLYYHTGIYRNGNGNVSIVGLPSGFFLHWHSEYHPRLYPHLSYNYYNFYENHYMTRFHESPHSFPRQGFYRSIENNVINNPRVNNRSLERIDRKRGNNIVRQPNYMESGSQRGGSSAINQSGGPIYRSGQGVNRGATAVPQNIQQPNSRVTNQRPFNAVNPSRSEGNFNQRGIDSRNSPVQRDTRFVPGQQNSGATTAPQNNNTAAPVQQNYNRPSSPVPQNYNNAAPVQQNDNRAASPAQQNYNRPAPAQQNYSRPAPAQQNYNRSAPVQQNYNRTAPAQQNYNRTAPAQQNISRPAPAQQNREVRESAPVKSSGSSDRPKPEKDHGRER